MARTQAELRTLPVLPPARPFHSLETTVQEGTLQGPPEKEGHLEGRAEGPSASLWPAPTLTVTAVNRLGTKSQSP